MKIHYKLEFVLTDYSGHNRPKSPMYFNSEEECMGWIRENGVKYGMEVTMTKIMEEKRVYSIEKFPKSFLMKLKTLDEADIEYIIDEKMNVILKKI